LFNFKAHKVGQSSVENLILVATALFIITVFVAVVWNQVEMQRLLEQQRIGSNAINLLADEIDDAYFLGSGTIKTVNVIIPAMIDFEDSYISGKTLVLSVGGSDLVASTSVEVRGSWPDSSGAHDFLIRSYGDYVSISSSLVSISPSVINATIQQGKSAYFDVNIFSTDSTELIYLIDINFESSYASVSSTRDDQNILLLPDSVQTIPIVISCSPSASGSFSATLNFISDVNLSVPITFSCLSGQTKLNIMPKSKIINIPISSSTSDHFIVCNGTPDDILKVRSQISSGINQYVLSSFQKDILAYSCERMDLNIFAPSNAGVYSGEVSVYSTGLVSKATLDLNVY